MDYSITLKKCINEYTMMTFVFYVYGRMKRDRGESIQFHVIMSSCLSLSLCPRNI